MTKHVNSQIRDHKKNKDSKRVKITKQLLDSNGFQLSSKIKKD